MEFVFVVSQPRSGSTLIQAIISNNTQVKTVSEPWILLPFLGVFDAKIGEAKYKHALASLAIDEFVEKNGGREKYGKQLTDFLISIYNPDPTTHKYILDKTPRYYEILDLIKECFPTSKILVVKRNPFATLNSIIDTWCKEDYYQLFPFERDFLDAPFLIHSFAQKHVNDANVKVIRYEDFVENPSAQAQMVFEWLGLEFNVDMLDYSTNKKLGGVFGDKWGLVKHEKPVNDNIDKWREKLNDPKWQSFFKGYSDYLGKDFLLSYGNYSTIENKVGGHQFKHFMLIAKHKLIEGDIGAKFNSYLKHLLYTRFKINLF